MNLASIILLVIIGILFILAVRHILKRGTCSCGKSHGCDGNCSSCGNCGKK